MAAASAQELESLLAYVRSQRGVDFSDYKVTSLKRRLAKRMHTVGVDWAAAKDLP